MLNLLRFPRAYKQTFVVFAAFVTLVFVLPACRHEPSVAGLYMPDTQGPFNVYLTFPKDTGHGMVVNYHTLHPCGPGKVYYDTKSHDGKAQAYAFKSSKATVRTIPYLPDGRIIHSVLVDGLEPGQTYYFVAGDERDGYTKERKFRTIPDGDAPIRFVEGGDMGTFPETRALLKQAAKQEPLFGVVGGDIAYASGSVLKAAIWDKWFHNWSTLMVTPKGYTIPVVAAIGNHEVNDLDSQVQAIRAPFYTGFFGSQSKTTYFARRFGNNLALIMLDSGHFTEAPDQVDWLKQQLTALKGVPVRFAVYHVPMYPSHRSFDGDESTLERKVWMPVFDQFDLTAAFEHHDHSFKRSKRLRGNKVDPHGMLYLGDGCFGQKARTVDSSLRWYLDKAEQISHFWVVDVTKNKVDFQAVDDKGSVFDQCSIDPATVGEGQPVGEGAPH